MAHVLSSGLLVLFLAVVHQTCASITIAPLGQPRILVSDAPTLQRLKNAVTSTMGKRLKSKCDAMFDDFDEWFPLWNMALMSVMTGNGNYCTVAVSHTDEYVLSELDIMRANTTYTDISKDDWLYYGEIIGDMSIVYDWCRKQMTDVQRDRWRYYGNITSKYVWDNENAPRPIFMGKNWAVNDPSNNYYYSFLRGNMMFGLATHGENGAAQGFLDQFRTTKLQNQLVPEFNSDLVGGGSREGTGYGTAMKGLYGLYYWWEKSTGDRIAELTPHTLQSLDKMMHDIMPTFNYIAPTGDQSRDSTAEFYDYHREFLLVISSLFPSDMMSGMAKTLLQQSILPEMQTSAEYWADIIYNISTIPAQDLSLVYPARFASGTGQFTMRSSWTDKMASWANFICGPYTQSHAHQDQLSFVIYKGALLASDETVESQSGLRDEPSAHNLVRLMQGSQEIFMTYGQSCTMKAVSDSSLYTYGMGDATAMYDSSKVKKMQREFVFIKPGTYVVFDRIDTAGTLNITRLWTINMHNMPTVTSNTISFQNNNAKSNGLHTLNVVRLAPAGFSFRMLNYTKQNISNDPNESVPLGGFRVDVNDTTGRPSSVFLHVLGADGAFKSAVAFNTGDLTGALITLADDSTVKVQFSNTGTGGTITFATSGGTVTKAENFASTAATLPRFTTSVPTTAASTATTGNTVSTSGNAASTNGNAASTTGNAATTKSASSSSSGSPSSTTRSATNAPASTGQNSPTSGAATNAADTGNMANGSSVSASFSALILAIILFLQL